MRATRTRPARPGRSSAAPARPSALLRRLGAAAGGAALALGSLLAAGAPAAAETATTPIDRIQGEGAESPLRGQETTTEGIVSGVYASGGIAGFNIQMPGPTRAEGHTASRGLFVYAPAHLDGLQVGDSVRVSGVVAEFAGSTQITASSVTALPPLGELVPAEIAWPRSDEERERYEGMLVVPQGEYTVSDNFNLGRYGEIGLAVGPGPLVVPTQLGAPGSPEAVAQAQDNEARSVLLDDGATTNYTRVVGGRIPAGDTPLPYLSRQTPVTVGAPVSFTRPVVVHYAYDHFRFQPQLPLTGANPQDAPAHFGEARTPAPRDVGGDVRLATFNVLNYFTHLGEDHCDRNQSNPDREGNPITANGCAVRGAWDAASFERQQAKIVAAIGAMDADIVALEEVEDSSEFGAPRDEALAALVAALNAAAGSERWAFVPSPEEIPASGDDVIRTAFVYRPETVELRGASTILDHPAFANARAPLAQTFADRASGTPFVVIVNHFKSKGGSGEGDNENRDATAGPAGAVGGWNGDRTRQAAALLEFSSAVQQRAGTERAFLVGDFNAYAKETPVTTITDAGYTDLGELVDGGYTYLYGGRVGSLDHVFASPAAAEAVTGVDVWGVNAYEPVALEYSRYNSNVVELYEPSPYRSSDHNPEIVGLRFAEPGTRTPPPPAPSEPAPSEAGTAPAPSSPAPAGSADLASTGGSGRAAPPLVAAGFAALLAGLAVRAVVGRPARR